MKGNFARIVVPEGRGDGYQMANGTQVWVGNEKLSGVLKVELVAETNCIWTAVIHCAVVPQSIDAVYQIRYASLWHYIKAWWTSRDWIKK